MCYLNFSIQDLRINSNKKTDLQPTKTKPYEKISNLQIFYLGYFFAQ